jgi:uncharacterized protein YPO0396
MIKVTKAQNWISLAALLMAPSGLLGCDRTPQEAHNEGVEAQRQADEKKAEVRKEASDKIAAANRDVRAATDDARREAAEAQANANEKIRDANREITTPHNDLRNWAQTKLDSVDNMIDGANAKAQAAEPTAKAKFNNAIEEVKHERDVLATEIASLETRGGDTLDRSKEQFSERVDRLKDNIRNIEKSL